MKLKVLALVISLAGGTTLGLRAEAAVTPAIDRFLHADSNGALKNRELAPQVRITSPVDGALIAPGDSRMGTGDPNGSGFAIVAEIVTRESTVSVDEDVNIRNVKNLSGLNPQFPGLLVFIDEDLITPDGTIIRANTNLGSLFNI